MLLVHVFCLVRLSYAVPQKLYDNGRYQCLDEAKTELQQLRLENGETTPLRFVQLEWDTPYVNMYLTAIIIQEVFGIEAEIGRATVSASGTAYAALSGCPLADGEYLLPCPGHSLFENPDGHIGIEVWASVLVPLYDLPEKGMAPLSAKPLGYEGADGMYTSPATVEKSYDLPYPVPLFYASFNSSRWDIHKLFSKLSEIKQKYQSVPDRSKAAYKSLEMTTTAERYVEHTGDEKGYEYLEIEGETLYVPRLVDGWWYSKACRQEPETCIPFVTSGSTGWLSAVFAQLSYFHNIRLAIGVMPWSDYVAACKEFQILCYWWYPDTALPGFRQIEFPRHNENEYKKSLFRTASGTTTTMKFMWRKLAVVNDLVATFLNNYDLNSADMDDFLLAISLKNVTQTKTHLYDVACDWIRANEERWQEWIPKQCPKNAGRTPLNETCVPCETGLYSFYNTSAEYRHCIPCPAGQYCFGGLEPVPCPLGNRCPEESFEPTKCQLGEYQDELGQTQCKQCPHPNMITQFLSATKIADCSCAEGFYRRCKTEDCLVAAELELHQEHDAEDFCVECLRGLECQGGLGEGGRMIAPLTEPNYMTTTKDASNLAVYQCGSKLACPGGPLGECQGGALSQFPGCSKCPDSHVRKNEVCEECEEANFFLNALLIIAITAVLLAVYFTSNAPLEVHVSGKLKVTMTVGMILNVLQTLGILNRISLLWPDSLDGIFSSFNFLLFDLSDIKSICFITKSAVSDFALRSLGAPLWICFVYASMALVGKLFHISKLNEPKATNTLGHVFEGLYISVAINSVLPFICYAHPFPNTETSVQAYPHIICGSEDHSVLVTMGVLSTLFITTGYYAACAYISFRAPVLTAKDPKNLIRFRFMFYRFRPDRWFWSFVYLTRNGLLALSPLFNTDDGQMQLIFMTIVLVCGLVGQCVAWPWRSNLFNWCDLVVSLSMIIIVSTINVTVPSINPAAVIERDFRPIVFTCMTIICITLGGRLMISVRSISKKNHETIEAVLDRESEEWFEICQMMVEWSSEARKIFMKSLAESDRQNLQSFRNLLLNSGLLKSQRMGQLEGRVTPSGSRPELLSPRRIIFNAEQAQELIRKLDENHNQRDTLEEESMC